MGTFRQTPDARAGLRPTSQARLVFFLVGMSITLYLLRLSYLALVDLSAVTVFTEDTQTLSQEASTAALALVQALKLPDALGREAARPDQVATLQRWIPAVESSWKRLLQFAQADEVSAVSKALAAWQHAAEAALALLQAQPSGSLPSDIESVIASLQSTQRLAQSKVADYRSELMGVSDLNLCLARDQVALGLARVRDGAYVLIGALLGLLALSLVYVREAYLSARRLVNAELYDALTRLPNRQVLRLQLGSAIDQGRWGELVLVKFERLTRVVHLHGPGFADQVLIAAAAAFSNELKSLTGRDTAVFRLDGTTFAALLDACTQAAALSLLTRVQQSFELPLKVADREVLLSLRAGLVSYPDARADVDDLLAAADTALRFARDDAKSPVLPYGRAMRDQVARREMLEQALHTASRDGSLRLYYQPQVALDSGHLIGVEALLRWQHPELGVISPVEFIPIAEETNHIVELGRWVLNQACAQLAAWQKAGYPPMRMSVNVSPRQLGQGELVDWVREALAANALVPGSLELEVTEGFSLHDMDQMSNALLGLRQTGVRIAIDDFGTGYSSLSYLRQLPVDVLKIDRSFIRGLHGDTKRYDLVRIVIDLGHALGFEVVAEGVEEPDEWRALQWLGCDTAQGYLAARPMLPGELEGMLLKEHWLPEGLLATTRPRKSLSRPLSRAG